MAQLKHKSHQLALDSHPARPLGFPTLFWLFIAGSLLGFIMEGCWHFLRHGSWGFRVATLWGPFCIIYGVGTVVIYLIALALKHHPPLTQFCAFALAGSAVEYLSSLFQEAAFGTVSWDYSHHSLNFGGRISLRMTLFWGAAGMVLMYTILPVLLQVIRKMRLDSRMSLCLAAAAFMCVNLLFTSIALMRWQERTIHASPAANAVEAYFDSRWPDERMQIRFPNMKFVH